MTRAPRKERSRLSILSAAEDMFRRKGFAATTMEEIAEGAGLTRKTAYNLFSSKEDIALALIARAEADDDRYRDRIAARDDAAALLCAIFCDSAAWCRANPTLAELALRPARRPGLAPPPDRPSFQGLVRDVVALGQAQGRFRKDEAPEFMALILLAVFGQAMLNALAGDPLTDDGIAAIVRIITEGIGA